MRDDAELEQLALAIHLSDSDHAAAVSEADDSAFMADLAEALQRSRQA